MFLGAISPVILKQHFGTATESVCPNAIVEEAQRREEDEKKRKRAGRSFASSKAAQTSITPERVTAPLNVPLPAPSTTSIPQWGPPPLPQAGSHQAAHYGAPANTPPNLPPSFSNFGGFSAPPPQPQYNFQGIGPGAYPYQSSYPPPPALPRYPAPPAAEFYPSFAHYHYPPPPQPYYIPPYSEFGGHPPHPHYPMVPWQQPKSTYEWAPPRFNVERPYGSSHSRADPGPTFHPDDPLDFPELAQWLEDLDQDRNRGKWEDHFSQLTARFEMEGFTSLLQLEGVTATRLAGMTGISDDSANRLTQFVIQDIGEIRANGSHRSKRARYD